MLRTLLGIWETPNKFITIGGDELEVYAFVFLLRDYEGKWPFKCYINTYKSGGMNIISQVLPQ